MQANLTKYQFLVQALATVSDDNDDCLLWPFKCVSVNPPSQPYITFHYCAYRLVVGPLPDPKVHRIGRQCGNKLCFRPSHFELWPIGRYSPAERAIKFAVPRGQLPNAELTWHNTTKSTTTNCLLKRRPTMHVQK